jgi:hypothetical protein
LLYFTNVIFSPIPARFPIYVDTVVRRWQAYTGEKARLLSGGNAFNEIEGTCSNNVVTFFEPLRRPLCLSRIQLLIGVDRDAPAGERIFVPARLDDNPHINRNDYNEMVARLPRFIAWTASRVRDLIEYRTGVRYHEDHVWRILRKLDWTCQRPTGKALERDELPALEKVPLAPD